MKKVLSVVLLVLACLFLYAGVLNVVVRAAAGSSPEFGSVLIMLVLSGFLCWGGVVLWNRWRMTTGVVSLVLAASAFGNTAGFLIGGSSLDPGMIQNLSVAMPVIAFVLLVVGVLFIVVDVKRNRVRRRIPENEVVDL